MSPEELEELLEAHSQWLQNGQEGHRAVLIDQDLRVLDLRGADLRNADLRGANLSDADLSSANLCGANVS